MFSTAHSQSIASSTPELKEPLPPIRSPQSYNSNTEVVASVKQRGYPDRRGMGAQSDFIAEQFVPGTDYRAQQLEMAQKLIAAGVNPEKLERMFCVPCHLLSGETPKDNKPED
jgi:hypothetical protein